MSVKDIYYLSLAGVLHTPPTIQNLVLPTRSQEMIQLWSVPFLSWSLHNCPVFPVSNYKGLQLSSASRKALKAKIGLFSVFSRLPKSVTIWGNSFVRGHTEQQRHEDVAPSWLSRELGRSQISPSGKAPSRPPMPPGARTMPSVPGHSLCSPRPSLSGTHSSHPR